MPDPEDEFDDEFTELTSAQFGRVDLVQSPAHGQPGFLVMKQDESAGLMDPSFVRELIAKAEPDPEPAPAARDDVTMTGSPGAIAAFIHKASEKAPATAMADAFARGLAADTSTVATRLQLDGADLARTVQEHTAAHARDWAVTKAKLSSAELNDLPDSAFAFIESGGTKDGDGKTTPRSLRHFAIHDKAHADNAAARIAQGAKFGAEAKPKVEAAQRRFGEKVSKESGVPDTITKADPEMDKGIDGLDPTVPLASPDEMAPGDPMVPGSPAWESIDAATAMKWTSIAVRMKAALQVMIDREMTEAVTADPDDADAAWNLQDAMCAVDFVIETLACFAVTEQAEADLSGEAMAMIGKALASFDPAPLEAIEGLAPIAKAGRVLSAANEAAIKAAAESLNKVLSSLPMAPPADDPVTKEAAVAADQTSTEATETAPADVAKTEGTAATVTITAGLVPGSVSGSGGAGSGPLNTATAAPAEAAPVAKADGDAPCVVYDGKGQPLGIVDMASITAIQGAAPAMGTMAAGDASPDGDMPMDAETPADPAAPADAAVDPSAPADPCDMTPQPADDAGTKTDEVTKAGTEQTTTITHGELESLVAKAVTAALDARAPAEGVSKSDAADALAVAKSLEDRLAIVEGQPAMPKVFTNGAVPPPGQLRGHDQAPAGGQPVDVAKAAALKNQLYKGTGPEQKQAFDEMQQMAVDGLAALHRR